MRLRPLYRLEFDYPESWAVDVKGEGGTEEQHLLFAEGKATGELRGRFRGANYARRRADRTALTDFRGVIETEDKAVVLFDCRGFGRRRSPEYDKLSPNGRQWLATVSHLSEDPKYVWLNDTVCVGEGQVRPKPVPNQSNPTDLTLEVAALVWEPIKTEHRLGRGASSSG
ncbi:MAG TPA: DUF3237 family protein [Nitrososphaerales archaeon]|nr:DUF3237 family protein [Nitrososphaerales archaeon]